MAFIRRVPHDPARLWCLVEGVVAVKAEGVRVSSICQQQQQRHSSADLENYCPSAVARFVMCAACVECRADRRT